MFYSAMCRVSGRSEHTFRRHSARLVRLWPDQTIGSSIPLGEDSGPPWCCWGTNAAQNNRARERPQRIHCVPFRDVSKGRLSMARLSDRPRANRSRSPVVTGDQAGEVLEQHPWRFMKPSITPRMIKLVSGRSRATCKRHDPDGPSRTRTRLSCGDAFVFDDRSEPQHGPGPHRARGCYSAPM